MVERIKNTPRVSVVMSVYNGEKYLREAINSILSQTFTAFEFIIIDDGSKDSSSEIVFSYDDSRIRFVQQENMGLPSALNGGVALAQAEYIARMDQDDISLSNRLEIQYDYLQKNSDVIALGTAAEWIDEAGEHICVMKKPLSFAAIKEKLPETPFIHPSVMFRKRAFYHVGGYPDSFKYAPEDAVLFNRMAASGVLENLPDVLIRYRITPQSLSGGNRLNQRLMNTVVQKELNGTISEEDYRLLEGAAGTVSPRMKLAAYHLLLGKKYLWDNPQHGRALGNLCKSIKHYPLYPMPYLLLLACALPDHLVKRIYRKLC